MLQVSKSSHWECDDLQNLPIHYASSIGDLETIRLLLDSQTEEGEKERMANSAGFLGGTPLMLAASVEVVDLLIKDYQAKPEIMDCLGQNAVEHALISSRESIAEAILAFPEASNCINYPLDGPKKPIELISPATKDTDNDYQWLQGCRILETDDLTVPHGFREEVYNAMPLTFILTSGD